MNKLFVVLLAGTFVLASASALADDKTPAAGASGRYEAWTVEDAHRVDRELSTKRKAEKDAAKAAAAKMTPEEKAAARKAARAKKQQELDKGPIRQMAPQQMDEADAAAAKAQPKALPGDTRLWSTGDFGPPTGGPAKRDPAKSNP